MASIVPSTPQNSQDFLIAQSHPLKKKDDFRGTPETMKDHTF